MEHFDYLIAMIVLSWTVTLGAAFVLCYVVGSYMYMKRRDQEIRARWRAREERELS